MLSVSTIENPDRGFDPPSWGAAARMGARLSRLSWQVEEKSPLEIREDDLTGEEVAHLLRDHLENMTEITPPDRSTASNSMRLGSRG